MHFSKAYSQLLLTLPSELRSSAIEYRQLKKLINELVAELESWGLGPLVLEELQQKDTKARSRQLSGPASSSRARTLRQQLLGSDKRSAGSELETDTGFSSVEPSLLTLSGRSPTRVVYELAEPGELGEIVPRLRFWVEEPCPPSPPLQKVCTEDLDSELSSLLTPSNALRPSPSNPMANEYVPPPADGAPTLQHEYTDDAVVMSPPITQPPSHDLLWNLQKRSIPGHTTYWDATAATHIAYPAGDCSVNSLSMNHFNSGVVIPLVSDTAFFHLLITAINALSLSLTTSQKDLIFSIQALSTLVAQTSRPSSARGKSDLYTWRAIFQLYMEAQVFESSSEHDRGERSVEESEARLALFAHRVGEGGFSFTIAASREGLQRFLELNVQLMNLKKFQTANAEAARKILKKHAKRTALPLPISARELIPALEFGQATASAPHILVVALTETLMPIVPHIDDYICLICTAIAFKPIRLRCGHFFCVRCLVKMQKKGQGHCPMCRAPTVLSANQSNVDHALINFMLDWFPREAKEKAKANEHESAKEKMEELGLDTRCKIM